MIHLAEESREAGNGELAATYDEEAAAIGWKGPSLVFRFMEDRIRPGQTVLDLGIGTGLGSEPFFRAGLLVFGMDTSSPLLDVCRAKGIAARLIRHDLTVFPYPLGDGSIDHVISAGVFQFFPDLRGIFREVARILPAGGTFAFVTGDRSREGPVVIIAGPERTGTGVPVTMYCHAPRQVSSWLKTKGFRLLDSVPFTVRMDKERPGEFPLRAYLAEKIPGQARRSTLEKTGKADAVRGRFHP